MDYRRYLCIVRRLFFALKKAHVYSNQFKLNTVYISTGVKFSDIGIRIEFEYHGNLYTRIFHINSGRFIYTKVCSYTLSYTLYIPELLHIHSNWFIYTFIYTRVGSYTPRFVHIHSGWFIYIRVGSYELGLVHIHSG